MRNKWNHKAPEMQICPVDNTSECVMEQVKSWAWADSLPEWDALVIHTESAMEIAAWWQSPGRDGLPFAEFASTGTISDGLVPAIERELRDLTSSDHDKDVASALRALQAYVKACN